MTKPKQDGPTFEAPTEWRRIVMEESDDGQLRLARVESVGAEGVEASNNASQPGSGEAGMPQEWHDILSGDTGPGADGISLQHDNHDPAEQTIPGMRIPQLYEEEVVSLDNNTGYSIGAQDISMPEKTMVGAAPQPPPGYEDFPFSQEPERSPAPKRTPIIVPQPQGEVFSPPPQSVISTETMAVMGLQPQPPEESHTPADMPQAESEHSTTGTVEFDTPEAPDEESTNELDAELSPAEEDVLDASDLMEASSPILDAVSEEAAGLGVSDEPEMDSMAIDLSETHTAGADTLAPMIHELLVSQGQMFEELEGLKELLEQQEDAHRQTQEALQQLQQESAKEPEGAQAASVKQAIEEAMSGRTQPLHDSHVEQIADRLFAEKEELTYQVLSEVFKDLLLHYDFVDLRLRSFWEQHGNEHPLTLEMMSLRDRLIELFQRHGLEPIEITDPHFDPDSQRALQEVETSEQQEDGTISRIFRQGFRLRGRVFRPSEVEVKRYRAG